MHPRIGKRSQAAGGSAAGYSVIELAAAVALAALVGATGVPRIQTMLASYDLANATQQLASDVRLARMRAVTRNAGARIQFRSGSYVVQRESPRGSGIYVDDGAPASLPASVTVSVAPSAPSFNSRGLAPIPATITLAGTGGASKTVSVNAIGRVTVN